MPNGNIDNWQKRLRAAVVALAQNQAGSMEGRAKETAPWTDRAGNARNGIRGEVVLGTDEVFLELANDGQYAVLKPTVESEKDAFLQALRQLMV